MKTDEKLMNLRKLMAERNIGMYIVPTSDFHQTEFVGEHFKARKYMSGFSGSDGTLVVGENEAALWVDGRYFLQAEKELQGSAIKRMEIGEPGVLTIEEYLKENLKDGKFIAFDGRVMNAALAEKYKKIAKEKNSDIYTNEDLVDFIWKDRPSLPEEKMWLLTEKEAGEKKEDKIKRLREHMGKAETDAVIFSALDDIAWLLNMRGNDIEYFPVSLSYLIVTVKEAVLFINKKKLSYEIEKEFSESGITIAEYDDIFDYVKGIAGMRVECDLSELNYAIVKGLREKNEILDKVSPVKLWKACKNPTELENTKKAHRKDGVAVTKFIHRIKKEVTKASKESPTCGRNMVNAGKISELDAADILLKYRQEQEGFIEPSFETIAAYGSNGAFVHYSPKEESQAYLEPKGFLLVDSGGHYKEGTTDVTRTIVLGDVTEEQKTAFTAVLKGMIRLSKTKFLEGCCGYNLDIMCRGALWDLGFDYKHGTGHGVGHILSVHEGPNAFRWKRGKDADIPICEGMITSNEPGFYKEGEFGIRTENELVAVYGEKNQFGQFMEFNTLTLAPIDKDAIDIKLLSHDEIKWLNDYHKRVYDTLEKFMDEEERSWLFEVTREI